MKLQVYRITSKLHLIGTYYSDLKVRFPTSLATLIVTLTHEMFTLPQLNIQCWFIRVQQCWSVRLRDIIWQKSLNLLLRGGSQHHREEVNVHRWADNHAFLVCCSQHYPGHEQSIFPGFALLAYCPCTTAYSPKKSIPSAILGSTAS